MLYMNTLILVAVLYHKTMMIAQEEYCSTVNNLSLHLIIIGMSYLFSLHNFGKRKVAGRAPQKQNRQKQNRPKEKSLGQIHDDADKIAFVTKGFLEQSRGRGFVLTPMVVHIHHFDSPTET